MFPLLLVLTTALGFLLGGRPECWLEEVLGSALVQFPIIGDQLATHGGSARGTAALAIGLIAALWGGLGVAKAAEERLANVWMVHTRGRPGFLPRIRGAVAVLVVLVAGLVTSTALGTLGSRLPGLGWVTRVALVAAAVAVNVVWCAAAFRFRVPVAVRGRDALPGGTAGPCARCTLER